VSVGKRTRFPGGVSLGCLFGFFPALGDLVLDPSAVGSCAPFAGLWWKAVMICYTRWIRDTHSCVSWAWLSAQGEEARSTKVDCVYVIPKKKFH